MEETTSDRLLLPLPSSALRDYSLHGHLAVEALLCHEGNAHLVYHLVQVLHLSYFLQTIGYDALPVSTYRQADLALDHVARRGVSVGAWRIDADDVDHVTPILRLHDRQMSVAPLFAVMEAKRRLVRFAESGNRCPWPNSAPPTDTLVSNC